MVDGPTMRIPSIDHTNAANACVCAGAGLRPMHERHWSMDRLCSDCVSTMHRRSMLVCETVLAVANA